MFSGIGMKHVVMEIMEGMSSNIAGRDHRGNITSTHVQGSRLLYNILYYEYDLNCILLVGVDYSF